MTNQSSDFNIKTFDVTLISGQTGFALRLPCEPFMILGVEAAERGLNVVIALPNTFTDQQNYRFYICRDGERIRFYLDSLLGTIRSRTGENLYIFGPRNGYGDQHVRWMGDPNEPGFTEPQFVLRRGDDDTKPWI